MAAGLAWRGVHAGLSAGRVALLPARMTVRASRLDRVLRRAAKDLAHDGSLAQARARVRLELAAEGLLRAPELERVAARILATADLDRVVGAVLDHELTGRAVDRALASPGLEQLVTRILESRLVDGVATRAVAMTGAASRPMMAEEDDLVVNARLTG